ncbi:MAG: amidohydrolase [Actinobacteria bacterium]|nr:amidohydrolase [Actinomycetota bacterium]
MIIDAHVHIFEKIRGKIKNGNTTNDMWGTVKCGNDLIQVLPPYNNKTQFKDEALVKYMEYEKIDKAVLQQGCFWSNQNQLIKQALIDYPDKFAGAMYIEPWRKNARKYFEENIIYFNALKLEISVPTGFSGWKTNFKLTDYMWLYEELAKRNKALVLDLGVAGSSSYQTDAVKQIIDKYGDISIVICHLGQPRSYYLDDPILLAEWKKQIELAKYGNVAFDTSSLSAYFFSETYPHISGEKFFNMALEITGPKRIMMGTDMPGNSIYATYKQMIYLPKIYGNHIGLNEEEIADIMGNNAEKIYFNKQK